MKRNGETEDKDGESKKEHDEPNNTIPTFNTITIVVAAISIIITLIITININKTAPDSPNPRKNFWAYSRNIHGGHLVEVFTVLNRLGYENKSNETHWDLLWAHDYPFRKLYNELNDLKPHQKVNHFPGCGYITNKVDLATSGLSYIPPAFKLPGDKEELIKYSERNPNKTFVQKNNDHRNIQIVKVNEINLENEGTFIQEYVDKPLLVSGYKFDIGIYVVITSVQPLRVYIYNGEALLRFCPVKYYPFDPTNLDKYVVGDDYLPTWQVPALDYYYNVLGFNMRDSLNAYLRDQGKNPSVIWEQVEDAIRTIILAKEASIVVVLRRFKSKRNFFEMMRFDLVINENLKVFLLEANMSPNLSSAHFPPNKLLYQQVLYNVLGLVGVGEMIFKNKLGFRSQSEREMLVSGKHIAVFPEKCNSKLCRTSCVSTECHLCSPCLSSETKKDLIEAAREHFHKGDCKRIFPPSMSAGIKQNMTMENMSPENQLHYHWFQGKCDLDTAWC